MMPSSDASLNQLYSTLTASFEMLLCMNLMRHFSFVHYRENKSSEVSAEERRWANANRYKQAKERQNWLVLVKRQKRSDILKKLSV